MIVDVLTEKLQKMTEEASLTKDFLIRPAGRTIRICCVDFEPSGLLFSSVRSLFCEERGFEETFFCFSKDSRELKEFLPENLSSSEGRYVYNGPDGRLAASVRFGLFSLYSVKTGSTYIWLCPDLHTLDHFISHPFHMEFGWWAQRCGLSFLHSACIGLNGKGILLSGAGGSGKSTLALTSLLCGMDLLSDDYLLVRSGARPEAIRLYSSAYLTEEILERLPELKAYAYWTCEERRKTLIDLAQAPGSVAERLPLYAVMIPQITHSEAPSITENPDIRTLIPLLASTSYQNRELRNKEVFIRMMSLLKSVPSFRFSLTDDIRLNAAYLRSWMEAL